VLQWVAVSCSELQWVAVCRSVSQCDSRSDLEIGIARDMNAIHE